MVMRSPNHRVVRTDGTRACYEIHNTDHTLVARHIRLDLAVSAKYVVHPEHSEQNGVAKQPFQTEEAPDEDSS